MNVQCALQAPVWFRVGALSTLTYDAPGAGSLPMIDPCHGARTLFPHSFVLECNYGIQIQAAWLCRDVKNRGVFDGRESGS